MALHRPRLPWTRKRPAADADASFFEHDTKWRPRPDSPEVSVFTPAEEAESHRRWNRAMLRERFRGPVTDAEQIGFGLSAAALAALVGTDALRGAGPETAEPDDDSADLGEVLRALKSAAATEQPQKAAVTAKATGPAGPAQAFLDTGADAAFSNPVSSRTDNGLAARRAAPRGGGAPFETRVANGAERADGAQAARKAEQAPSEARAPSLTDGASALRGPMEADVAAVAIAAMVFEISEVRDGRDQVDARAANTPKIADAGRAPAEAPAQARAKDAPPVLEARADARGNPVEAFVRDKSDAQPVVEAKASADGGRGGAEAAGRSKAKDAATAEVDAAGGRSGADAQAKPQDTARGAEPDAGLGHRQAKAAEQARPREVDVVEAKVVDEGRSAADSSGQARSKDAAPAVFESKAHSGRDGAEAPQLTTAWGNPNVLDAGSNQGRDWWLTGASNDQGKAKDTDVRATGTKAEQSPRQAEAALPDAPSKASAGGASGKADAGQLAGSGAERTETTTVADTKTETGRGSSDAIGQPKTKDTLGSDSKTDAPGQGPTKTAPLVGDAKLADAVRDQPSALTPTKDAPLAPGAKPDAPGQVPAKTAPVLGDGKLADAARDPASPAAPTKDAPGAPGAKPDAPGQGPSKTAATLGDGKLADAARDPASPAAPTKDAPSPPGGKSADALGQGLVETKAPLPGDTKVEPGRDQIPTLTPPQTKDIAGSADTNATQRPSPPAETLADPAKAQGSTPAAGNKPESFQPAGAPGQAKNPSLPGETKAEQPPQRPADETGGATKQANSSEQGKDAAQPTAPPAGEVAPVLPAGANGVAIHVADLWSRNEGTADQGFTLVVPREEGTHATGPAGADEPQTTRAMSRPESDLPGGEGAKPAAPGSAEKTSTSDRPSDVAPNREKPQPAADEVADLRPDTPGPVGPGAAKGKTEQEAGGKQAFTAEEALSILSTPTTENPGPQPRDGGPAGKGAAPDGLPPVLSVPESVWQFLPNDTVLL